jgi:hypothetical protein
VNVRELRTKLRSTDKTELVEILVEIYKTLPKTMIEEKSIDEMIVNRRGYLETRQREREAAKRVTQTGRGGNTVSMAPMQKWMAIPEHGRQLLLNNVWCSHCGEICRLWEYTVELAGRDIVLQGSCPVCHHDVARYVETD